MFSMLRKLCKSTESKSFCQQSKKKLNNVENQKSRILGCLLLCMFLFLFYITKSSVPVQFSPTCAYQSACVSANFVFACALYVMSAYLSGCIIGLFEALYLLVHLSAILSICLLTCWLTSGLFWLYLHSSILFSTLAYSPGCMSNTFALLHSVRSLKK